MLFKLGTTLGKFCQRSVYMHRTASSGDAHLKRIPSLICSRGRINNLFGAKSSKNITCGCPSVTDSMLCVLLKKSVSKHLTVPEKSIVTQDLWFRFGSSHELTMLYLVFGHWIW